MEEEVLEVHTRNMVCELGLIQRADGSAKFTQGETTVTCGVFGPVEVKGSKEQCDQATVEVSVRGEVGVPGSVEYQLEGLVATCCESVVMTSLHPHSAISVSLQINGEKGSVIACAFNALCLALMDASLPMKTTFSALTCGFKEDSSETLVTDPDLEEEEECDSLITYVIDRQGNLLCSHTLGLFTRKQFQKGLGAAKALIDNMTDFYRTAISRKMSRINKKAVVVEQ